MASISGEELGAIDAGMDTLVRILDARRLNPVIFKGHADLAAVSDSSDG